MQCSDRLLIDRLDRHRIDRLVAGRLENRLGVGPIGLVTVAVAAHIGWWQQQHGVAQRLELAAPVVSRPTRFHQNLDRLVLGEEALEPTTRQPVLLVDPTRRPGHCDLEDGLCEIHCYLALYPVS